MYEVYKKDIIMYGNLDKIYVKSSPSQLWWMMELVYLQTGVKMELIPDDFKTILKKLPFLKNGKGTVTFINILIEEQIERERRHNESKTS